MKFTSFDILDSTSLYIKRNYEQLEDFQVVIACHQTKGKGRHGNDWLDDGNSALFSILIKSKLEMDHLAELPLLVAMVTHQVLFPYLPKLLIKWPNDLVVHDKKLAGILIETISSNQELHAVIIGIGINLYSRVFHSSIRETATSFILETEQDISSSLLVEEIAKKLEIELELFKQQQSQFIDYCKKYASLLRKKISFIQNDQLMHGTAIDIKPNGNLLVKTAHDTIELNSGEVQLIK